MIYECAILAWENEIALESISQRKRVKLHARRPVKLEFFWISLRKKTFYFEIAAMLIVNFKLVLDNCDMEADENIGSINVPKEFRMKFVPR